MRTATRYVVAGTVAGATVVAARTALAYAVGVTASMASSFEAAVQRLSIGSVADRQAPRGLPTRLAADLDYRTSASDRVIDLTDEVVAVDA